MQNVSRAVSAADSEAVGAQLAFVLNRVKLMLAALDSTVAALLQRGQPEPSSA